MNTIKQHECGALNECSLRNSLKNEYTLGSRTIKRMLANPENISCQSTHDQRETSDTALWNAFRGGDRESFEAIYKQHVDSLYSFGILIFKDKAIVEDATQDLFVDLWRRKEFLGETSSIKFYLRKALKRNIIRKLETKERLSSRYALPALYDTEFIESPEADTITQQSLDHTAETLLRAIKSLPEKQREIIVYKFYDNLSSQEISSAMSISLDSVYTLISRAVKELRKRVKVFPSV